MIKEQSFANIYKISKKATTRLDDIRALFPGRKLCICDMGLSEDEYGLLDDTGVMHLADGMHIDHHQYLPCMYRQITSTAIACAEVRAYGPVPEDWAIVINHIDTDSVLSALVAAGLLPPDDWLIRASVAADHTGAVHLLSDVLQSLEHEHRLDRSIRAALSLFSTRSADGWQAQLERRDQVRRQVLKIKDEVDYLFEDGVALLIFPEEIDAGMMPILFPAARVIIVGCTAPESSSNRWRIKVRLGLHEEDMDLRQLNLPNTGGRWNAISTSRHGDTDVHPINYFVWVKQALAQQPIVWQTEPALVMMPQPAVWRSISLEAKEFAW